ncbi:FxsA family protein [Microbispora sp. CSR-4]|uniref:FxsA family protein n=1 Tax=Microbispora sp. CSR-4 TaxID=2592813 RepID=UPI0011CAF3EC
MIVAGGACCRPGFFSDVFGLFMILPLTRRRVRSLADPGVPGPRDVRRGHRPRVTGSSPCGVSTRPAHLVRREEGLFDAALSA